MKHFRSTNDLRTELKTKRLNSTVLFSVVANCKFFESSNSLIHYEQPAHIRETRSKQCVSVYKPYTESVGIDANFLAKWVLMTCKKNTLINNVNSKLFDNVNEIYIKRKPINSSDLNGTFEIILIYAIVQTFHKKFNTNLFARIILRRINIIVLPM